MGLDFAAAGEAFRRDGTVHLASALDAYALAAPGAGGAARARFP
ncbi:MAG TPA: hypothetical protein VHY32_07495 [Caulobacteraceae bacterium]|jgi:hypothetical protein|nr:hypothetical protein [Caulobacteraceae bacterium]